MFNRFTSRALQVLFYARSEVSQIGSSAVEPEHILLGAVAAAAGHQPCEDCFQRVRLHAGRHHRSRVGGESLASRHHTWAQRRYAGSTSSWCCRSKRPRPRASLLRSAIEQHFAVDVKLERRMRDVYVLTNTNARGQMLRRYPDPEPGTGFALVAFSVFMGRSQGAPMFPLDAFTVHSVPFLVLVNWFEETLGGQLIDQTDLPGIYGFELKERVNTPEAFIQLLRDEAGLVITRQRRERPTLIVRQRKGNSERP